MITFKTKDFNYSPNGGGKNRVVGECLSSDTKPTDGIANGSTCIEMDTGDKFMFDEANQTWLNITNPSGGDAEVWLVMSEYGDRDSRRTFLLSNVGDTDHMAELYTNAENYQVFLNGEELPTLVEEGEDKLWIDGDASSFTKCVDIALLNGQYDASAIYMDVSTAPTSVEVSVKAK